MNQITLDRHWQVRPVESTASDEECLRTVPDKEWIAATVPGDIHQDLARAGHIEDPYVSDNCLRAEWVTEKDWCFRTTFSVPAESLQSKTSIVFKGIDTFSTVWLNGKKLGTTDNMFRQFAFDISEGLQGKKNELIVRIASVKKKMEAFPGEGYFACFNVPRIFIRKAQCHFGWDWAPDFPATGIWLPVEIVSSHASTIDDVAIRTTMAGDVTFFSEFSLEDEDNRNYQVFLEIKDSKQNVEATFPVRGTKDIFTAQIPDPELWWPRGYGDPNLYSYTLVLLEDGLAVAQREGRFGIREVEIVEEPTADNGITFRLEINNTPVFVKGANWVPLDLMTGAIDDQKYIDAITMAAEANFNMLRVWGGGIYEKETFYDLCDQQGIMVWQDFMFACADTPDDQPWFVEKIIPEVEYQVKRLRNHPALVMWCGGNEKTGSYGKLKSRGDRSFHYFFRGICGDLDPHRPYISSSPFSYGDVGNTEWSGDTHCNSYQPALKTDINSFRKVLYNMKPVFASEIAVQGSSRYQSIAKFIPEEKLWPTNEIWDLHFTKNPYDGSGTTFVQQQQRVAEDLFGPFASVKEFIKRSMTTHKEFVEAEAQYHRARMANCGGAMFWMFSDIWPSGTWALADYYLLPKPAFFAAKRSFAPLILSIQEREDGTKLFVINDKLQPVQGEIIFGQETVDGQTLWQKQCCNVSIPASSAVEVATFSSIDEAQDAYLFGRFSGDGHEEQTTFFPKLWRQIPWPEPNIAGRIVYQLCRDGIWINKIELGTERYARMVHVNPPQGTLVAIDDNFFDLRPGEVRQVTLKTTQPVSIEDLTIDHWLTEWD